MGLTLVEALWELHVVPAVSEQTARPHLSAFFLFSVFDLLFLLLLMPTPRLVSLGCFTHFALSAERGRKEQFWVSVLAFAFTISYRASDKSFHLSEPQCPSSKTGVVILLL